MNSTKNRIEQVFDDEILFNEIQEIIETGKNLPKAKNWNVSNQMLSALVNSDKSSLSFVAGSRPWTEAVVMEYARPTLLIQKNKIIELPQSSEMRKRIIGAKHLIEKRIPSVGRIEFMNHPTKRWGGTGWIISDSIIITNRHVVEDFAYKDVGDYHFLSDFRGTKIKARIDFREEHQISTEESFEVEIKEVLFMEDKNNTLPDIAILKLTNHGSLPEPIPISKNSYSDGHDIAIIGYPANDIGGYGDGEAAARIFGDIFDVKRLSPGKVRIYDKHDDTWFFTHDATTLRGNSGSVVLDLETGRAIGMHFRGHFHEANYAIKGNILLDYIAKAHLIVPVKNEYAPKKVTFDTDVITEGNASSYIDRKGFDSKFLGETNLVPLPIIKRKTDVLTFSFQGKKENELKYKRFSVKMSKSRRLCFYSAVNINGKTANHRIKRPKWRLDPRIEDKYQIIKECYGNFPKFSRGHMTRRKDPMWGTKVEASLGNSDSMHVTNAVPQIQPFNAGIWLGLEDYALENAKQDDMKISVITGPFFDEENDPVKYKVKIPVSFWKIIVFIHDETSKLSATGYIMSQEDFISENEFVFGRYKTYQMPIKVIERRAELDFGKLTEVDGLTGFDESLPVPLVDYSQIKFY